MRPDTRQHLTACTGPSEENGIFRHSARSPAAVKPLRGSSTPFRPLRVTAAADRAGSPCGPAGRLALRSRVTIVALGEPLRCRGAPLEQTEGRRRRLRKGLHFRRRPHTSVHDDRNRRSTPPDSVFNFPGSGVQDRGSGVQLPWIQRSTSAGFGVQDPPDNAVATNGEFTVATNNPESRSPGVVLPGCLAGPSRSASRSCTGATRGRPGIATLYPCCATPRPSP